MTGVAWLGTILGCVVAGHAFYEYLIGAPVTSSIHLAAFAAWLSIALHNFKAAVDG